MREVMIHTGQHHDPGLSDVFFDELGIPPPTYNLGVSGGRHGQMTGAMLSLLEEILLRVSPRACLVYGDTNSTLAGALAAAKMDIPVVHIEAGLRSYNRRMAEEINRVIVDHVSDLLLCPTDAAVQNLAAEGITAGVVQIGDVMFDAFLRMQNRAAEHSTILARLGLRPKEYVLSTAHRAENTDTVEALAAVMRHLDEVAKYHRVVLPLHPRTERAMQEYGLTFKRVETIPPVGYLDMAKLVSEALEVHTDSGGLQKEAYFARVPCVTMRSETEWVETVDNGWNRLWTEPHYQRRRDIAAYGKGDAAGRVAEALIRRYGGSRPPCVR